MSVKYQDVASAIAYWLRTESGLCLLAMPDDLPTEFLKAIVNAVNNSSNSPADSGAVLVVNSSDSGSTCR